MWWPFIGDITDVRASCLLLVCCALKKLTWRKHRCEDCWPIYLATHRRKIKKYQAKIHEEIHKYQTGERASKLFLKEKSLGFDFQSRRLESRWAQQAMPLGVTQYTICILTLPIFILDNQCANMYIDLKDLVPVSIWEVRTLHIHMYMGSSRKHMEGVDTP